MNASSITGILVLAGALIWLFGFVPGWVKQGERGAVIRETTRHIKQRAKEQVRSGRASKPKRGKQAQVQPVVRTDYRALYAAALEFAGETAPVAAAEVESGWQPRALPAPMHTTRVGTLEQLVLASVTPMVAPETAVIGENLDEILRRRRAI